MKKMFFVGLAIMSIMSSCKKQELTPNSETSEKTTKPHVIDQEKAGSLAWAVGSDYRVYRWNPAGNNWAEPNPAARMISISVSQDNSGAVWALGTDGHVFRWNAATSSWDEPNNTVRLSQISACSATEAWGVIKISGDVNDLYRDVYKTFNGGATWSLMPATGLPTISLARGARSVSAINGTTVVAIGRDSKAYTFNYSTNVWSLIKSGDTQTFDCLSGGISTHLWGVAAGTAPNNTVYKLSSTTPYSWITPNPAGLMTNVSASVDGVIWGIGYDGRVYRWNAGTNSWDEPNPAARLRMVSSGNQ